VNSNPFLTAIRVEDEDREIELTEFFSEKCTDILMDYGYDISVMPVR